MTKKKVTIFIFFLILTTGIIAHFIYPVIKERYSSKEITLDTPQEKENNTSGQPEKNNEPQKEFPGLESEQEIFNDTPDEDKTTFNVVRREDCENECENFTNEKEKKYCQEICGLVIDPKQTEEQLDCANQSGLEKDYCLKRKALEETNFSVCRQIQDYNILKSCENRITEELFEKRIQ